MPDGPPLRLERDIGADAAEALCRTRGTGRRMRWYRRMVRDLVAPAYPPRVALVGAGDILEVADALLGLKMTRKGPSGMDRALYILHRAADAEGVQYVIDQPRHAVKGARVVTLCEPWGEELDALTAGGHFWFPLILLAPTTRPQWTLDALRGLAGLCRTGTLLVALRSNDKPMKALIKSLNAHGWTDVPVGGIAILKRGKREPLPPLPPATTEGESTDVQRGTDSQPTDGPGDRHRGTRHGPEGATQPP